MAYFLQNEELEVRIAEPGEDYRGTRFDWSGLVTQVTARRSGLTYCSVESEQPGQGSGGIGLCNEFGIEGPPGFDTAPGGWFTKIGIGRLQRPDDGPYDFMRAYPLRPYRIETEGDAVSRRFTVQPEEENGYACRLEKTLTLEGSRLRIAYRLANTGAKAIDTEEYVHNFLRIGAHAIGPDYVLTLGDPVRLLETDPALTAPLAVRENELTWTERPAGEFYSKLSAPEREHPFTWELRHRPTGAYVRESGDFPVERLALWGHAGVVSPEAFVRIRLQPGEEETWTRTYEFSAD